MKRVVALSLLLAAFGLVLGAYAVFFKPAPELPPPPPTPTAREVLADGELDTDFTLASVQTEAAIRKSTRPVYAIYATQNKGEVVYSTAFVPGVAVSADTIVVSDRLFKVSGVLVAAFLVPVEADKDAKAEKLSVPNLRNKNVVQKLQPWLDRALVPLTRPITRTLAIEPVAFSPKANVPGGKAVFLVGIEGGEQKTGQLLYSRLDVRRGQVQEPLGSLLVVNNVERLGEAVYTLRDGDPEFLGIAAVSVGNADAMVVSAPNLFSLVSKK